MSLCDKGWLASVTQGLKVDQHLAEAVCIRKLVKILKATTKDVEKQELTYSAGEHLE